MDPQISFDFLYDEVIRGNGFGPWDRNLLLSELDRLAITASGKRATALDAMIRKLRKKLKSFDQLCETER